MNMENQTIQTILSRRSVRKYRPNPLPRDLMAQVLACGQKAPSGGNKQYCHFIAVTRTDALDALKETVRLGMRQVPVDETSYSSLRSIVAGAQRDDYDFVYGAPALVLVCNKLSHEPVNAMADSAAANQNLLLAAVALGLGGCWINHFKWLREDTRTRALLQQLGIKPDEAVFAAAALGYPQGAAGRAPRLVGNIVTWVE